MSRYNMTSQPERFQTHVADQVDGIYVLRPASMITIAHAQSISTAHPATPADTDGLYTGYTRSGLHWLPSASYTTDHTRLETVYNDEIIQPETNHCTLAALTTCCSHVTRNNESHNVDEPSPVRIYTTYEMHTAAQVQLLSTVTVRPKSPHEGVHAFTGHSG